MGPCMRNSAAFSLNPNTSPSVILYVPAVLIVRTKRLGQDPFAKLDPQLLSNLAAHPIVGCLTVAAHFASAML